MKRRSNAEHIWNQLRKWNRESTNKPMFGLVVLEIA